MSLDKVNVTQALLDANGHIDVTVGDDVLPTQVTAPVTQAMLDADPALAAAGVKVGDVLSGTIPKDITGSFSGTLDTNGNFTITLTVDLTGTVSGIADANGVITSVSAPLKV